MEPARNRAGVPTLQVESLVFTFASTVRAELYDKWQHYAFNGAGNGQKAVDVVAVEVPAAPTITWLIEAKDYRIINRQPQPANLADLPETVAKKIFDTIAGLADASANAQIVSEKEHATLAMAAPVRRVVLYLEPHVGPHTALFPLGFAAGVLQKLKQLVRSVDTNPLVLNLGNTCDAAVPWSVV